MEGHFVNSLDNLISQAFMEFLKTARAHWATKSCPDCGKELKYRNCTFFYEGQTWEILLPTCIECHPTAQVAPAHDA